MRSITGYRMALEYFAVRCGFLNDPVVILGRFGCQKNKRHDLQPHLPWLDNCGIDPDDASFFHFTQPLTDRGNRQTNLLGQLLAFGPPTLLKDFQKFYVDFIKLVIAHINHVVKIAGIDHVGLGSDFDGVGDSLPIGLKSVADYPNLIYHLLEEGYSEQDVKKMLAENVLRVWQKAVDFASSAVENN